MRVAVAVPLRKAFCTAAALILLAVVVSGGGKNSPDTGQSVKVKTQFEKPVV